MTAFRARITAMLRTGLVMALPISYNIRNLRVRWQVTLLAIAGIALVVAVFVVLDGDGERLPHGACARPDRRTTRSSRSAARCPS